MTFKNYLQKNDLLNNFYNPSYKYQCIFMNFKKLSKKII